MTFIVIYTGWIASTLVGFLMGFYFKYFCKKDYKCWICKKKEQSIINNEDIPLCTDCYDSREALINLCKINLNSRQRLNRYYEPPKFGSSE